MKSILLLVALAAALGLTQTTKKPLAVERMDLQKLDKIIRKAGSDVKTSDNYWEFTAFGARMACVTDASHDRMRIISPILKVAELTADQKDKMLEANFHSALDARYAISNDIVWAAFIHPLSPLQESEVQSAMRQVAETARTFGTTYSSGELVFGTPTVKQ